MRRAIALVARREFRDSLHNRWLIGFGVLFALLSLLRPGRIPAESASRDFPTVSASMLNLVLYALPLVSMIHASARQSADSDVLLVLLTQPVGRAGVLAGGLALLGVILGAWTVGPLPG